MINIAYDEANTGYFKDEELNNPKNKRTDNLQLLGLIQKDEVLFMV